MNFARVSIERSRVTFTVLATMLVMGLVSYNGLARDSMPPYTVRVASVVSSFPGASPERVEQLVTDKIEKAAQELPELKKVASTSRAGLSVVTVELKDDVGPEQLQAVWDRLRRKLEVLGGLPSGVSPSLKDDGIGDVYGIMLALSSDGFSYAEMKDYADDLRDELIKLPGAASVEIGGIQEERIFVEFDNARLREYNISSSILQNAIGARNILSSGGQINLEDERIVLEPTGNYNDLDDIKRTLVPVAGGTQLIFLGDIATVRQGYIDPPTQLVRVNGREALSLHVNLRKGDNIIALGRQVDGVVDDWREKLPIGLEVERAASLDGYIDGKVSAFIGNLIQAIAIVLVVMLVFLGFRTGTVIASLIPIVSIMTIMVMGMLGVGLNQVTLAALIMALGMMVDNAIVVAESVVVNMEAGMPAKEAAIAACRELFTPLLISTLTTSAAFLAFYMAESVMGDMMGPIFVVISIALLSSWLVALTVTTMFCYLFLEVKSSKKPSFVDRSILKLKAIYKDLILLALSRKYAVVGGVMALFVASLFGFMLIPFVFFPDSDRALITVDINLPLGTRIERTSDIVAQFEEFMSESLLVEDAATSGVLGWSAFIGKGPESYDIGYSPDEANSSYAHLLVTTSAFEYNNEVISRLDDFGFNTFPGADIKVGVLAAGGGGTPIEVKVSGSDPDLLAQIAERVKLGIAGIPGTKNIKDDWGPKGKKFVIEIDQARAQAAGVTSQDVATSLRTVLDGFVTGEYREGDKSIPIVMRSEASQQQTLASLETVAVFAQHSGASIPLLQVASVVPQWQYSRIKRVGSVRTITISSELTASGNAAEVTAEITPFMEEEATTWPSGYAFDLGGDAESTAENMGAVIKYLPVSAFIIVLLLIIQFNSIRKMTMVVATVPLAVIGVVIGLMVFREPFGFMPFLGVISLAGIVINNAIVLLDRIQIEQTQLNRTDQDAVIMACLQRFRPILLATFTTVFGLLPLYLGGGEMWEGMAIGIMVGLLFGTVITLVFIPSLYSILFKVDFTGYHFDEAKLS